MAALGDRTKELKSVTGGDYPLIMNL